MIANNCSDSDVMKVINHMYMSFKFINDYLYLFIFMLILNFYIDYLGLPLSYGSTWTKMKRNICGFFGCIGSFIFGILTCFGCRCCKKKTVKKNDYNKI